MNLLNYFIEANLCLAAFYMLFRLFLYHETGATFNRMSLLGALLLSVIVPLFHFGILDEIPAMGKAIPVHLLPELIVGGNASSEGETASQTLVGIWDAIAVMYLGVGALLLARLLYRCVKLWLAIRDADLLAEVHGVKVLVVEKSAMTFSVFNCIVLGDPSSLNERERRLIIRHESAHIRKGHTWDILIAELLCIVFWFNPAVWALKRQLQDVHEYEADQDAVQGVDVQEYCGLLARITLQSQGFALVIPFSRSLTVKRIHMIKSAKNKISRWKIAALVPAIAGVLGFVACQDQVMSDVQTIAQNSSMALDMPPLVENRLKSLRAANPEGRYIVIEVQDDGQEKLKNLEKEYGLPTGIEVIRSGGTPVDTTPFQDVAEAGRLIVHSVQFGNQIPDGRVFAILEYDERAQGLSKLTEQRDVDGEIFLIVEEAAHPIGGMEALYSLLAENISYPAEAREAGITGRVFIEFIVEKDGTLTNFKSLKGIGHGCDEEAIRVLSMSPPWNPGKQRGQPVRQKMVLPVVFNL